MRSQLIYLTPKKCPLTICNFLTLFAWKFLAHGDGDIDPQVAVLGEQLCDGRVKHQAVAVHDGRGDALVDRARRGLPGQAAPVPVELQPVGEVLGLLASPDELHDGKELLVAVVLLLLLQHQHEVEAEARLHHYPVHRARQVDVRGQEHNVLPLDTRTQVLHVKSLSLQKLYTSVLYTGKPNDQIFYFFGKNIADELNHNEQNK